MPTVYLWEYWWSCVPFCYTLEEVEVCLESTKIYLDESIWTFFAYIYEPMLFPLLWLIKFSLVLSIFFLHNFSLLQFHWKKARENDILQLYEHSWRKSSTFTPWTRSSPFSKSLFPFTKRKTQNSQE